MCFKLKIIITYITFLLSYKCFQSCLKGKVKFILKVEALKVQDED